MARREQETILTTRQGEHSTTLRVAEDERVWFVFSEIPAHQRRYARLFGPGRAVPGNARALEWQVPAEQLRINKKRKVSDAQREAARVQFAAARAGSKSG